MILVDCADERIRRGVERAARPDEAVVADPERVREGLLRGFPRLFVRDGQGSPGLPVRPRTTVPVLDLGPGVRGRFPGRTLERGRPTPADSASFVERVALLVAETALPWTWVDRALGDLARAAGAPLPLPLRTFVRYGLELPTCCTDLGAYAELAGMSRGALKARFRRRGLESPFVYLRWMRVLAVAETLSDRGTTVTEAARVLAFTSAANMCRMVRSVTGMTPGRLRDAGSRNALVVRFAHLHLTGNRLERWASLADVFGRRVA